MKHVTLRQLKVFEAVARHLSFSRAAEKQLLPLAEAFNLFLRKEGARLMRADLAAPTLGAG